MCISGRIMCRIIIVNRVEIMSVYILWTLEWLRVNFERFDVFNSLVDIVV